MPRNFHKTGHFLQTVFWRSSPQIIIPAKIQWNWPIFLRTFLDNPMKLDFFSANYHKPWLSWFPNQMFLGLCHLFLSQKRLWDRNAQWSTIRTSMIVGGYHKWATCTWRHKMEGGGTFHEVWHWQMQWVGGCKQPCAKSWGVKTYWFPVQVQCKERNFCLLPYPSRQ